MAHLEVPFCMVCEDVRPELLGKLTILGFFGLLPDVNIKVSELDKPIQALVFLFFLRGDTGKYSFEFSIQDPDGSEIRRNPLADVDVSSHSDQRSLAAIGLNGFTPSKAGKYTVKLFFESKAFYTNSFFIEKGAPELFPSK